MATLRRLQRLLVAATTALATPLSLPAQAIRIDPGWSLAGRARVTEAPRAMVVSGSPIASQVGRDIMQQGGNAIDAAVALGFEARFAEARIQRFGQRLLVEEYGLHGGERRLAHT